jgi:hypothetical protein
LFSVVADRLLAAHLGKDVVETFIARLRLSAVSLDPLRHQVEDLRLEVARPPLGVSALRDETGVGQDPHVLGHRLHRHPVRLGELAHRGVANREASQDAAPGWIGESGEDSRQLVVGHEHSFPDNVVNRMVDHNLRLDVDVVNLLVEDFPRRADGVMRGANHS